MTIESAALVHLLDWNSASSSFVLSDGITLCRTKDSDVEKLYVELCKRDKINQGEPYTFPSHILLDDSAQKSIYPYSSPYSIISRCCNIITICLSNPVGMCRIITSGDNFQTDLSPSHILYEQHEEIQLLRAYPKHIAYHEDGGFTIADEEFGAIKDGSLRDMKTCWQNHENLITAPELDAHRLDNALSYFFYAWRAYNIEHICLNLAIVLESLFSPSATNELSHQIAYNLSSFCGGTKEQRQVIYDNIKKFYRLRSSIVHGGRAKDNELCRTTPYVFHLCADILKRILLDYQLAQKICDEKQRKNLLDDWLFA